MAERYDVMNKFVGCCVLATFLLCGKCWAGEGFWLERQLAPGNEILPDIPLVKRDIAAGLPLQHIQRVSGKINDCSTAFVSPNGLLMTSYHCIAPHLSTKDSVEFISQKNSDDMPIPGLELYLPQQSQDVTVAINRELSSETSVELRNNKLSALKQKLLNDCAQQGRFKCELVALHYGLEFYLVRYKVLRDIRLVYQPEQGADVSQQSWPRYSRDYVMLRAYSGATADGSFSENNIPYQSSFSRLSRQGIAEHELVISPGFSAASQRYATEAEIRFNFEVLYPRSAVYLQQAAEVIEQLAQPGTERAIKYSAVLGELKSEAHKVNSLLDNYQHSSLLKLKHERKTEVLRWINNSPVRQQLYGPVVDKLQQVFERQQAAAQRDLVLGFFKYTQLPALARQLYQLAVNPDKRQTELLREKLSKFEQQFDARVDMELALHFLGQYSQLPLAQRLPALDQYFALSDGFNREIVRHKLFAMYRGTTLTDPAKRSEWLGRTAEQFKQSNDPLISFAVAMHDTAMQLAAERQQLKTELTSVRSALMEVLIAFNEAHGKATYADANGALRFNLGRVSGYQPMDAVWYQPFSSLSSYQAAQSGDELQNPVPAVNIPVNFLSSTDSCSNYGTAPTFNTKGELVGIMFAGVQENLLADWHYDARKSRSVHVDSRFMLWQLQQTAKAKNLLAELLPGQ